MNVVIYLRYSSHNQNEQSIEGQLKVCEEYAKRNDFNIIGTYKDEARSGTSDSREQFQKMIEDSKNKTFQGVLVYQLDRFARNRLDSATYKAILKRNGVRVFSARENITDDASGILMESVLEGMAEYYSVELGQKVIRGMNINAEHCYYNGGTVPIGLKLKEISLPLGANGKMITKKQFDIDEEKAPIIRKMFEMYINGSTMADIIKYLNDRGIQTSYKKPFSKNSIRNLLTNQKYRGLYSYNGIEVENAIPRIVEDDMFFKAQEKLEKNKYAPSRSKAKTEYLLTTKLFCGKCKEMMTGMSGTSGTGKLHCYYSCKGTTKHKCDRKNIQKDYIEEVVVKLAQSILTDEMIDEIAKAVYKTACIKQDGNRINSLQRDFINIEKEKESLLKSLRLCNGDNEDLVRKTIFDEIAKVETQKKEIETQIKLEKADMLEINIPEIKYFFKHLRNGDIQDMKYKKMVINVLINKVYVYDDNFTIIFNVQDETKKLVTKQIPTINEIESSFLGKDAEPKESTF